MQHWRLLDTPPMTAAENMALDETLLELKAQGRSPNTIRFLQFSPRAVLVGFHQAVSEEIRTDFCREKGIDINRRITGGGAVFFDENQLGWEVFCEKAFFNAILPNVRLFKALCDPVVAALALLNVRAEFRPRNDIEVNGRKISGTGGTDSGDAFMFQGTMLVDFDVDTMLRALKIPVEKLKAKEIDSVKDRVTCLKWETGDTPALGDLKQAIRRGFEQCLDIRLEPGGLTREEERRFTSRIRHFRSPGWIDAVRPRFRKREAVQSSYKAPAGMVRFTLVVDLPRKRLKDIYITGDFLSFPGRALYDLEAGLRGAPLDRDHLHSVIRGCFDDGRMTIPGLPFEDFIKPLDQCLEKIDIAKYGIPLAHCNMISLANGSFDAVVRKLPSVLLLPYCAKFTGCDLRYEKGCRACGEAGCSVGPAWNMGRLRKMKVVSIVSFEDLWGELTKMKAAGVPAYIGCCCQPFFAKHVDDFQRSGLPGILLDIDNTTCYDLDQAKQAYAGRFESQTRLDLALLATVLRAVTDAGGRGRAA
ncbi:biotin/lipoate A/B protein ligase family protein [Desulfococcus sp.]|uniref:lipoate--protein ligase family protein n=1 Tax=Desulfococcus sp. TaxID=2025834 RepID=UPI003594581D